ncbi:rod shape-determining protein [Erysipelotrichaceae bacterium 51-3]
MFESSYLIDPGAHMTRMYDPKTRSVVSVRSCRLAKCPQVVGQQALEQSWQGNDRLVYPFSKEKIKVDPAPLIKNLFAQAPADRYLLVPRAGILSYGPVDEEREKEWQQLMRPFHLSKVSFVSALEPVDSTPSFHIHAGASLIHFITTSDQQILDYYALPLAGLKIDEAISREITRVFQCLISSEDACALKEAVSNALSQGRNPVLSVTGLNQHNEYVQIRFRAADLWGCIEPVLRRIAQEASRFVCRKGPEIMEQVLRHPVLLTGGLASCYGFSDLLKQSLHCEVQIPDNPAEWVLERLGRHKPVRY